MHSHCGESPSLFERRSAPSLGRGLGYSIVLLLLLGVVSRASLADAPSVEGTYREVLKAAATALPEQGQLERTGSSADRMRALVLHARTPADEHIALRCTVYRDAASRSLQEQLERDVEAEATTGLGALVPPRIASPHLIHGVVVQGFERAGYEMQGPIGILHIPRSREIEITVDPLVVFSVVGAGDADPMPIAAALIEQLDRVGLVHATLPPEDQQPGGSTPPESTPPEAGPPEPTSPEQVPATPSGKKPGTPYWIYFVGGLLLLGAVGARVQAIRTLFAALLTGPLIALTATALGQVALDVSSSAGMSFLEFTFSPWTNWQQSEQWLPAAAWLAAGVVGGLVATGPVRGLIGGLLIPLVPWVLVHQPRFLGVSAGETLFSQVLQDLVVPSARKDPSEDPAEEGRERTPGAGCHHWAPPGWAQSRSRTRRLSSRAATPSAVTR